tara:strand:+ start:463 stop:1299 length:837 start_codon:yes stop_codon:yes gene_type:complete
MARISPSPGQKLTFVFFTLLSALILYIDIATNNFDNIKNGFKFVKISSFYIVKNISIEPIMSLISLSKSKNELIAENKNLKKALNTSYLNNYLISRENIFFKDEEIIRKAYDDFKYDFKYDLAQLRSINPNMYKCCDKHRMYIEVYGNSKHGYVDSIVFNSTGILGQVIDKDQFSEVLLLTDTSHSLPIKSESNEFFCNANGSGRAEIITCSYNPLVWNEDINFDQVFYTSGLGGIYPKDVKIGYVKNIEQVNSTINILEIKLLSNPLDGDLFGVLKY